MFAQELRCPDSFPWSPLFISLVVLSSLLIILVVTFIVIRLRSRGIAIRELPEGIATVVVTDVEGSTELWEWSPSVMKVCILTFYIIIVRMDPSFRIPCDNLENVCHIDDAGRSDDS